VPARRSARIRDLPAKPAAVSKPARKVRKKYSTRSAPSKAARGKVSEVEN